VLLAQARGMHLLSVVGSPRHVDVGIYKGHTSGHHLGVGSARVAYACLAIRMWR
jgi:hypothetical protein